MDDCISCGKSSLLLTSDQQEHLLLLSGVDDAWTGHFSWTHSSVQESVISSVGCGYVSQRHTENTHTHEHTHTTPQTQNSAPRYRWSRFSVAYCYPGLFYI